VSRSLGQALREVALRRVVEQLTDALPIADDHAAIELLAAARADTGIPLRELDAHIAAHPDALRTGDPDCPLVVVRLTHALRDAGYALVVPPGCAACGKITLGLERVGPTGRICRRCWIRATGPKTCARCGRLGRIDARRPEGGICSACYRRDPLVVETCGRCGRLRAPVLRLKDGTALCQGCWSAPVHVCQSCGQPAPAHTIRDGAAICRRCYDAEHRPRRDCGRCGRQRPIAVRATGDHPDLCSSCYQGPEAACSTCGRRRPCYRDRTGVLRCASCRPRPQRPCCRCGRTRPTKADWPIGPVCATCYDAVQAQPRACASCHVRQPLIALDDAGNEVCGPCAGVAVDYACRNCGHSGRLYANGRCTDCVLGERLRDLLAGPDGTVATQLNPLLDALAAANRSRSVLVWLQTSPSARLLAKLAAERRPITHELLDQLPPSQHLHYVRQVLVHTGVLPERHEDLDRIPPWLEQLLADQPRQHALLLRPFVHWFLLRRARRRAAKHSSHTAAAGHFLRHRVLVALEFLSWLDAIGVALHQVQQAHVDQWLAIGTTSRYDIAAFLSWAHARGLVGRLTVPSRPRQDPSRLISEPERWAQLQRCLTDADLPLDVRAAGSLILLFGLQGNRIRQLAADQLSEREGRTYLTLDQCPLLLPPRVAQLLWQLTAAPIPSPLARSSQRPQRRWLFPGRLPGQPISADTLMLKLRRHGIVVSSARTAALIALATDLPAPVLAELLDLHISTAVRWVTYVKRDWTDYLAARAAEMTAAH
jgi:hypothetical protein